MISNISYADIPLSDPIFAVPRKWKTHRDSNQEEATQWQQPRLYWFQVDQL